MTTAGCHVWCARQADAARACTCSPASSGSLGVLVDLVAVIYRHRL